MLTQTMPALVKALTGVLPPQALKQLTQSLGNCQQPLTGRGDVNLQPPQTQLPNGIAPTGTWNPSDYPGLFPDSTSASQGFYDMPGWSGPGTWNVNNYGGNTFNFPTNDNFNINQSYGGPTFNVGGNTVMNSAYTTNLTTNNLTTQNINVSTINNYPVAPGPPPPRQAPIRPVGSGPPGDGEDPPIAGGGEWAGGIGVGRVNRDLLLFGQIAVPTNAIKGGSVQYNIPVDACKGGSITVSVTPSTTPIYNVTEATLDQDNCTISLSGNSVMVVTGVSVTAEFHPDAATYDAQTQTVAGVPADADFRAAVTGLIPQAPKPVLVPV
jgi:hypothetical protein